MIIQLETLESLISFNKEYAESIFKEHKEFAPMIVGYTKDNKNRIAILGHFENSDEKENWYRLASLIFLVNNVDKYVVMTEGWAVRSKENETDEDLYKYGSLADHPNRMEVLSIVAVNKHGAKMSSIEIMPDKTLKPISDMEGYGIKGRITELLPSDPDYKPTKKDLDIANTLIKLMSNKVSCNIEGLYI